MWFKLQLISAVLFIGFSYFAAADEPLETVQNLDIDSYMGEWHQIAAIPAWFQRKCTSDTRVHYARVENKVEVTNRCLKKNGEENIAKGLARINKKYDVSARLKVTFVKIFGKWVWSFGGDYWVMDLDEAYMTSVVGEPKRKYLWILSRNSELSLDHLVELEEKIRKQHYDTCKIKITQEGELKGKTLCSIVDKSR